jgi:hypothetical protein
LFSTVTYARHIVFATEEKANQTINRMSSIHKGVETSRGTSIPDWAYRDVLYMLIDYSIRSYELLERNLKPEEKEEVFNVFNPKISIAIRNPLICVIIYLIERNRIFIWQNFSIEKSGFNKVGRRMGLRDLPESFSEWLLSREEHMKNNLILSHYTKDLFLQYKKHLGWFRFLLLVELQTKIVPTRIRELLRFRNFSFISLFILTYKLSRRVKLDLFLKSLLMPPKFKEQIKSLDVVYPL